MTSKKQIKQYNRNETDPRYMRMPWGKYRGYFMKDVPINYIKWCVMNYSDLGMSTFMKDELLRREPKWRC